MVQGDSWKKKEYKNGGAHGVKSVLAKYQSQCGNEQCQDLARAAAYKIARDYCPVVFTEIIVGSSPGSDGGDIPDPFSEAKCRNIAIMSCPGYILGKIEELMSDNRCEWNDTPNTGELLALQKQCEDNVDELIG